MLDQRPAPMPATASWPKGWWLACILAGIIALRLATAFAVPSLTDEQFYAALADDVADRYSGFDWLRAPFNETATIAYGGLYWLLYGLTLDLIGQGDAVLRSLRALGAVILCLAVPFALFLGRRVLPNALPAALLWLSTGIAWYCGKLAAVDSLVPMVAASAVVLAAARRHLVLSAAILGLAVGLKLNAILVAPLLVLVAAQSLDRRGEGLRLRLVGRLTLAGLAGIILANPFLLRFDRHGFGGWLHGGKGEEPGLLLMLERAFLPRIEWDLVQSGAALSLGLSAVTLGVVLWLLWRRSIGPVAREWRLLLPLLAAAVLYIASSQILYVWHLWPLAGGVVAAAASLPAQSRSAILLLVLLQAPLGLVSLAIDLQVGRLAARFIAEHRAQEACLTQAVAAGGPPGRIREYGIFRPWPRDDDPVAPTPPEDADSVYVVNREYWAFVDPRQLRWMGGALVPPLPAADTCPGFVVMRVPQPG